MPRRTKRPTTKDRFVTIRVSDELKKELVERAKLHTRSLSAQAAHYIKTGIIRDKIENEQIR